MKDPAFREFPLNPPPFRMTWWQFLSYELKASIGNILNKAGLPGFVHAGTYQGFGVPITVTVSVTRTTIQFGDYDIILSRLTGRVTSVGIPTKAFAEARKRGLVPLAVAPETREPQARS